MDDSLFYFILIFVCIPRHEVCKQSLFEQSMVPPWQMSEVRSDTQKAGRQVSTEGQYTWGYIQISFFSAEFSEISSSKQNLVSDTVSQLTFQVKKYIILQDFFILCCIFSQIKNFVEYNYINWYLLQCKSTIREEKILSKNEKFRNY